MFKEKIESMIDSVIGVFVAIVAIVIGMKMLYDFDGDLNKDKPPDGKGRSWLFYLIIALQFVIIVIGVLLYA